MATPDPDLRAPVLGQPPGPPPGGYGGAPPGASGANFGPAAGPLRSGGGGAMVVILAVAGVAVMMVGILAVLAIFGVRKYIANAKTAEVKNTLGQIAKDAVTAAERETLDPNDRGPCRSASSPVPREATSISGKKYQSDAAEWEVDAQRNAGFACLHFSMTQPQYYQYAYEGSATSFQAIGRGDLDGDGHFSRYSIGATVTSSRLHLEPTITETDPEE